MIEISTLSTDFEADQPENIHKFLKIGSDGLDDISIFSDRSFSLMIVSVMILPLLGFKQSTFLLFEKYLKWL